MKYGVYSYNNVNIGDDVQSLASERFLPEVNYFIDREKPFIGPKDDVVFLVANGWYMHRPSNFVFSENIKPLFVSMHIAVPEMLTEDAIAYLKQHMPIGCRDLQTKSHLNKVGIEAYFSGCLTLTLEASRFSDFAVAKRKVALVDLAPECTEAALNSFGPQECTVIKHGLNLRHDVFHYGKLAGIIRECEKGLLKNQIGKNLLKFLSRKRRGGVNEYLQLNEMPEWTRTRRKLANEALGEYTFADLIVTSRLHCALPALAFGKKVVFVHKNPSDPRFIGLVDKLVTIVQPDAFIGEPSKWLDADIRWDNISAIQNFLVQTVSASVEAQGNIFQSDTSQSPFELEKKLGL